MATYYVDYVNGNDSTGDGSKATPWKTITNGPTAARTAAGDTIYVFKTPDPVSMGITGSVSYQGLAVTTSSAVGIDIDNCDSGWSSGAKTVTHGTGREGTNCVYQSASLLTATGKIMYKTLSSTLDLSSYQQVCFFARTSANIDNRSGTHTIYLDLCSDTTGDTPVVSIPFPSIYYWGSGWFPVVFDNGSALPSNINSVALRKTTATSFGATLRLDNIYATYAPSNPLSLTPNEAIGFGSTADTTSGWYTPTWVSGGTSVGVNNVRLTDNTTAGAPGQTWQLPSVTGVALYKLSGAIDINTLGRTLPTTTTHEIERFDPTTTNSTITKCIGGFNPANDTVDGRTWFVSPNRLGRYRFSANTSAQTFGFINFTFPVEGVTEFVFRDFYFVNSEVFSSSYTMNPTAIYDTNFKHYSLSASQNCSSTEQLFVLLNVRSSTNKTLDIPLWTGATHLMLTTTGSDINIGKVGALVSTSNNKSPVNVFGNNNTITIESIHGNSAGGSNGNMLSILGISNKITLTGKIYVPSLFYGVGVVCGNSDTAPYNVSDNTIIGGEITKVSGATNTTTVYIPQMVGSADGRPAFTFVGTVFDNETEVILKGYNTSICSRHHDNVNGVMKTFLYGTGGLYTLTETSVVHTAGGQSLKFNKGNYATDAFGRMGYIPLFAGYIPVKANKLVTISGYFRTSGTSAALGGCLRVAGGYVAGVANDVRCSPVRSLNSWAQGTLTFTPTEGGIIPLYIEFVDSNAGGDYGAVYVDDISITQAD